MTISHPAPRAAETATGREPGPNQWIKDHLDSVIDAEFLNGRRTETAGTRDLSNGSRP